MTDVSKILNGLQPSATYTVQVRSKNSDGEYSDWSNSYTFSTPSTSITTYNSTVNTVLQGGSLIAGDLSNANVQINSAGIFGYTVGSVPVFSIPTDPSSSPTFAGFSLVQSGLTAVGGVVTSASGAISSKTAKIPLNAASSISS